MYIYMCIYIYICTINYKNLIPQPYSYYSYMFYPTSMTVPTKNDM